MFYVRRRVMTPEQQFEALERGEFGEDPRQKLWQSLRQNCWRKVFSAARHNKLVDTVTPEVCGPYQGGCVSTRLLVTQVLAGSHSAGLYSVDRRGPRHCSTAPHSCVRSCLRRADAVDQCVAIQRRTCAARLTKDFEVELVGFSRTTFSKNSGLALAKRHGHQGQ